jgi:hypothetical protein
MFAGAAPVKRGGAGRAHPAGACGNFPGAVKSR